MVRLLDIPHNGTKHLGWDERGVTGLDAGLITIAFVLVASVFAFTTLTTGLFATDRAKETVTAGLAEARGTMVLKGSIVATASASGSIDSLNFLVTNAAGGEAIDMTVGTTIVRYTDKYQTVLLNQTGEFTATQLGSGDGDSLMEAPEAFEIKIPSMIALLATDLGADQTFSLEVIPPRGAVLFIQRTLPISLETINTLDQLPTSSASRAPFPFILLQFAAQTLGSVDLHFGPFHWPLQLNVPQLAFRNNSSAFYIMTRQQGVLASPLPLRRRYDTEMLPATAPRLTETDYLMKLGAAKLRPSAVFLPPGTVKVWRLE